VLACNSALPKAFQLNWGLDLPAARRNNPKRGGLGYVMPSDLGWRHEAGIEPLKTSMKMIGFYVSSSGEFLHWISGLPDKLIILSLF